MTDTVRKIFFVVALVLSVIALMSEWAFGMGLGAGGGPGLGVRSVGIFDCLLLFTVLLIALSEVIPERIHGRLQGIGTLIVSILELLAAFAFVMLSLQMLVVLLALISSPPFGWIIYLAAFELDRSGASKELALSMLLKLFFAGFLVLAQERYLQNKGLVLLTLTSLVVNLIVSFLQGFVPGLLSPVTDAVAAIVVSVVTLIWAVWTLIMSVPAIVKVLMVWRSA